MAESNKKHRAREYALQLLYMWEFHKTLNHFGIEVFWKEAGEPEGVRKYTENMVKSVTENLDTIDDIIRRSAVNWRLERMPLIDRNILRLATWELLEVPETPMKVVMDEFIELAKKYGSEDSPAFINGILDQIGSLLRPSSYKRSNKKA